MTELFVILLLVVIYFVYNTQSTTHRQIIGDNSVGIQAKGSINISDDNMSYEEV